MILLMYSAAILHNFTVFCTVAIFIISNMKVFRTEFLCKPVFVSCPHTAFLMLISTSLIVVVKQ
jgi:hypothetical protein